MVADLLSSAVSSRERSTRSLSPGRPCSAVYMSPNMPAKVFRRFFIVSSVSSPSFCDWLPCRWNGILGGNGGSSVRRPTDGAALTELTVLDWEAARNQSSSSIERETRGKKRRINIQRM